MNIEQILDLVASTQPELQRLKLTNIAQGITKFHVMNSILTKDRVEFQSGTGWERSIQADLMNSARHVEPYEPDVVMTADTMKKVKGPWRMTQASYAIEAHEEAFNRPGQNRIQNFLNIKRNDALMGLIKLMEDTFWSKPEDSSDKKTPFGLFYWLVPNATAGFNGGNAAGFPDGPGGLIHANFKNYTDQYTNVTKADLIKRMRTAAEETAFELPPQIKAVREGQNIMQTVYTSLAVKQAMETLAEQQNDNLGRDLASMDGKALFHGMPIIRIPALDSLNDPVLMVNKEVFYPIVMTGWWLKESKPQISATQHNVVNVFIDTTWNLACTDRRRLAYIQKA